MSIVWPIVGRKHKGILTAYLCSIHCKMVSLSENLAVTEPSSGKQIGTMFFLHGSGDTGPSVKNWVQMCKLDASFSHVKIVYPTAPRRPYNPYGGQESNVWFDRVRIDPFCQEHLASINSMGSELMKLIELEVQKGIPINKIVIGGFSMGGAMAMHLAFRFLPNLAGVFALSSFLNDESVVYKELEKNVGKLYPPLLQCHGDVDDLIRLDWGEETYKKLQKFGIRGAFHVLPNLHHELSKKEIELIFKWTNDIISNDS